MAKKEVKTDLWVARQLDDCKIKYDAQGSDVKELNDALIGGLSYTDQKWTGFTGEFFVIFDCDFAIFNF